MSVSPPTTSEDCSIVDFSLGLWLGCLMDKPTLREEFMRWAHVDDFALKLLFCPGDDAAPIRKDFRCVLCGSECGVCARASCALLLIAALRCPFDCLQPRAVPAVPL